MARYKDHDWNLPEGTPNGNGGFTVPWDALQAAVLMDIRDELRKINATLRCPSTQRIPRYLARIAGNTAKKKPKA
jgi:hypothetical protein